MTVFASPPEDTAIVTVADVKNFLRIPLTDTTYDSELSNLTYVATDMIEAWCNRPIAVKTMPTEFHDGWQGDTIMLKYTPVVTVTSLTEVWSTGGAHVLPQVTDPTTQLYDGYQLESATGRVVRVFDSVWPKPFFPGSRNIVVVYSAGFSIMPPSLWHAARVLAAHYFQSQQSVFSAIPKFTPGQQADFNDVRMGDWQGMPPVVEALIKPYRRRSIG